MVRKKLATVVAALGTLQAGIASALGIGDLSLQSALNQPLVAEIEILNSGDLDDSQVIVGLASAEDFKNAGVSRDFFLTDISFEVELDGTGNGVIKLRSKSPVVEPYLNFLVETRWPSGRLLREYTVLMDLPVFSESQAKPVQQVASSQRATPASRTQQPESVPTAASVPLVTQEDDGASRFGGDLSPGGQYRVRNDDTLWVIAAKARPSRAVSVQQTMLGIQRINPNAFVRGNINRLKAGSVLRLPTEDQLYEVSKNQAVAEVANQNRAWRTGVDNIASDEGAQLDATASSDDSDIEYRDQDRLSIATVGDSDSAQAGEGEGSGGMGAAALRDQLMQSEEMLDKTQLEKEELQSRLDDVEAKLATVQRLLELKENQLAALQSAQLEQEEMQAEQPLAATESADDIGIDLDAEPVDIETSLPTEEEQAAAQVLAQQQQLESDAEDEVSEPASAQPAIVEAEPPKVAESAPPESAKPVAAEPGFLDKVLANPLYLGGAGLLAVAAIVVLMLRRRREQEEELDFEDEQQSESLADVSLDAEDLFESEMPEQTSGVADQLAAELEEQIAADNAADFASEQPDESQAQEELQPETGDAIAEADIYVAYGRYQQAVDLLRSAISREPQRADLQVKLLEVYIETRDKPGFQQQYVQLSALGDDNATARVKEVLSSVDGVADWLQDLPAEAAQVADEQVDTDFINESDSELAFSESSMFDTNADLDLELDDQFEFESGDSSEFDDLDMDLALDEPAGEEQAFEAVDGQQEEGPGDISLELDDNSELGDFSLDLDESAEISDFSDESIDLGDMSLELDEADASLELDETDVASEQQPAAVAAEESVGTDNEFDLDLDSDSDFDLDFADLAENTDLNDLASEFGDTNEPGLETAGADIDDLELELDLGDDQDTSGGSGLTEEMDLSALQDVEHEDLAAQPLEEPSVAEQGEQEPLNGNAVDDASLAEPVNGAGGNADFDFLADTDEVATKLDLARAYIDMGDTEGAKDILDEVLQEGSSAQKREADSLIERIE